MDFDSDSWDVCFSASSGRNHSRSDLFGEDADTEDGLRPEYICPFCAEEFDGVGLCCHVDEDHPVEAKTGVCPVCMKRVGVELVSHLTLQHGSVLKVQRKKKLRKRGSNLPFSTVRKELHGNLDYLVSSSNSEPDPLLSSFIYNNVAVDDDSLKEEPHPSLEASFVEETRTEDSSKRNVHQTPPPPDEDTEERARKCEFIQGLLLSTFLDDDL